MRHDTIVVTAQVAWGGEVVPKWIVFNIPDQYQKLRSNLGINATEIRNGYALPSNLDIASVISELSNKKLSEDDASNLGFKLQNTIAVGPNTVIYTFETSTEVEEA
ncbi:hypothetical protein AAVH_34063 [Aphelenchoides avenae]|nr:hypothetical protein AAVH_34063 [Aphelenchus avenae]